MFAADSSSRPPSPKRGPARIARLDAEAAQDIGHEGDIGQPRHIGQHQRLVAQQAGGHERQGGVLGAADGDFTLEPGAALDANAIHNPSCACAAMKMAGLSQTNSSNAPARPLNSAERHVS